jgi:hypothetical protein
MGAFRTVSYGVGGIFYRLVSSLNSQVSYQLIWKLTLLLLCLLLTTITSTTAKKESRFDVNISYINDGVTHGVASERSFTRLLLNLVDVDCHNTIFSISSHITKDLRFGILLIFIGIYDSLINTRRYAIIGNYGSWRGPGGRCSISEIYNWDGQTVLSAHRLF